MENTVFDNIIIGAGPAGMQAAAISRRLGESVCVVEADKVGGTCLNRGCIPTKALVRSASVAAQVRDASRFGVEAEGVILDYAVAAARKDEVVESLRSAAETQLSDTICHGEAHITGSNTVEVGGRMFTSVKRIIIATGSVPARLPLPGAGLAATSDDFLRLNAIPEEMVVIGGGVIGLECACIATAFGCRVTVIEYCREILPGLDPEMAKRLRMLLSRKGMTFHVGAAVKSISGDNGCYEVCYDGKGGEISVGTRYVLMAAGRHPRLPDGLEKIGVNVSARGITVDKSFATSVPGIYAVGDCNGELMLAHAASAQAEVAMGVRESVGPVPSVVFSSPECAQVGILTSASSPLVTGKAMYGGNGMAVAMGMTDGFVKVAVDPNTRQIAGCCAIGLSADAIVQEAAIAMASGMTADELRAKSVFAHPTVSELLISALPA